MFAWMKKKRDAQHGSRGLPSSADRQPATAVQPPAYAALPEPPSPVESAQPKPYWSSGGSQVDWMEEMYNDQVRKGAFDNLPGKGKPLEIQTGDVFHSILKNANVLPEWLRQQHEIRDQIGKLIAAMRSTSDHAVEQAIGELNVKIKKYNTVVPSSILQKGKLTKDNLERQYEQWQ